MHKLAVPKRISEQRIAFLAFGDEGIDGTKKALQFAARAGREKRPQHARIIKAENQRRPVLAIYDVEFAQVPADIIERALLPLERMLAVQ